MNAEAVAQAPMGLPGESSNFERVFYKDPWFEGKNHTKFLVIFELLKI